MIQILLATFNGESFLKDQLDSLLAQSYEGWAVLIHDDGSSDKTVDIIRCYCKSYPNKFYFLDDGICFGNSKDNFSFLLEKSTAEYVMFCDQDDVWLPEKIELTLAEMNKIEAQYSNMPIVVHTDLRVVDSVLSTIAESMFSYQGLPRSYGNLTQALAKNSVTGCTMMLNAKARHASLPIHRNAVMHDWWIAAMTLKAGGVVKLVDVPLILYRQHGGNAVGAKRKGIGKLLHRLFNSKDRLGAWSQAKAIEPHIGWISFFVTKFYLSIKSLF